MIDRLNFKECCLCGACKEKCPKSAIDLKKQEGGFWYPVIDHALCIGCEVCEKVCPVISDVQRLDKLPETRAFAARSESVEHRLASTSGAVFYELGKYIIEQGGYVCGTVFQDDFQVSHQLTNDLNVLKEMRGSKYAQSNMTGIYEQIRAKIKEETLVLFCGCPCQVAALKNYVKDLADKLITIDFVCHGIPSQQIFDQYREQLKARYRSKITDFQFRNKKDGWHRSSVYVKFANGRTYSEPITVDPYMKAFLSGTTMKESCYECRFKSFASGSDITLGDFWGAEVLLKDLDDNTGLSAVMVNTKKGMDLLETLPVNKQEVQLSDIIRYNKNICESTSPSSVRNELFALAKEKGFGVAIDHYFKESTSQRFARLLRFRLRQCYYMIRGREKPLY